VEANQRQGSNGKGVCELIFSIIEEVHVVVVDRSGNDEQNGYNRKGDEFDLEIGDGRLSHEVESEVRHDGDIGD
jgi:hypothetical protein